MGGSARLGGVECHGLSLGILYFMLLKNGPEVKLYTGIMRVCEMLKNFVRSQRARKAYYLYSEIAT